MEFNEPVMLEQDNHKKETDRLHFMKNIHFNDELETVMKKYFEHIVGMYDICIDSVKDSYIIGIDCSIDAVIMNDTDIKFSIIYNTVEDAINMESHIKLYTHIIVYHKVYNTSILRQDNKLNITISYQST